MSAGGESRLSGSSVSIAAVLLLGAALLVPRLGAQSLWLDESLTITPAMTATSIPDLVRRVRAMDTQPPASHFVLYAIRDHVPRSEFFYRLPSFVAVELGIAIFYLVVRRLWGPKAALIAAASSQLSPFLCFYAAEARNYSLWFLLITTSILIALHWIDAVRSGAGRSAWAWAIALVLTNALGLWTHLFHIFVLMAEGAVLLVLVITIEPRGRRAQALVMLVAAHILTILLFAPWLLVVLREAHAGTAGVSWTRPFGAGSLAYYLFAAHFGTSLGPDLHALHVQRLSDLVAAHPLSLGLAAVAVAVTITTYGVLVRDAARNRARRWELLPLVVWPLCSLAGPIAYGWLRGFPLHPRHLMMAWLLLPIVVSLGLVRYQRLRPLLVASLLLQVVGLGNLLFVGRYAKDDERGAVHFAERRSGTPAYVLGDVANLYATRIEGKAKGFVDFPADTHDVWLVDNRTWEESNQRVRARLARKMRAMGMHYEGGDTRFHGIVLRHWSTTQR